MLDSTAVPLLAIARNSLGGELCKGTCASTPTGMVIPCVYGALSPYMVNSHPAMPGVSPVGLNPRVRTTGGLGAGSRGFRTDTYLLTGTACGSHAVTL